MSIKIYPTKWMPKDKEIILNFVKERRKKCEENPESKKLLERLLKLHPSDGSDLQQDVTEEELRFLDFHKPVENLYVTILTDPKLNMFFHQMFWQQNEDGIIPNWQVFIVLLNLIMTYTPVYSDRALVGFPINALINWPMATTAGFACFLNDKVNLLLKNILNY